MGGNIRGCQGPCIPVGGGGPKVKDECKEYITQVVKFFFKHSLLYPFNYYEIGGTTVRVTNSGPILHHNGSIKGDINFEDILTYTDTALCK